MVVPVLLVHGGAAAVAPERLAGKMRGVKQAAAEGYALLVKGASAVEAVEHAVRCLEDNEYFNAGYGSALNTDYEVEMDASLMDGRTLCAGAVALVKDVRNPIRLARSVLERSPHVLFAGPATSDMARAHEVPLCAPADMVSEYARTCLDEFIRSGANLNTISEKNGTVGAVACDSGGHVAAGTSTGGVNGQAAGRIGDTPLIGLGTYADDEIGAVSCTGHGESIIKMCLANSIVKTMEKGAHASNAARINVQKLTLRLKKEAGAIVVSNGGEVGFFYTSPQMPVAYISNNIMYYGNKPNKMEIEKSYKLFLKKNSACNCEYKTEKNAE